MTWRNTLWMGHPILKCPLDLWIYQELVVEIKPAVIVESGTAFGGSALYLASICDIVGQGKVVTVDVEHRDGRPDHPRISYLTGSSTSDETFDRVLQELDGCDGPIMVILDSDHRKAHVLAELRRYGPIVSPGSYLIVEDTNLNGHPIEPHFGPGPAEAVEEFLNSDAGFRVDRSREKLYLTFNPGGYLRKVAKTDGLYGSQKAL
ncbi:MAG: CmcI family methyltransferase [Acidobacteria bacterium]|nr:CmcI family methyltransferase [Acidobacteriota bacterium]